MTTNNPRNGKIPIPVIEQLRDEYSPHALTTITVTKQQKDQYKDDKCKFALRDETPKSVPDPIMVGVYCWTYDQVEAAVEGDRHRLTCQTDGARKELPSLTLSAQRRAELKEQETSTVSVMNQQLAEIKLRKNRKGNLDGRNHGLSSPELFELLRRAYHWFVDPNANSDFKLTA